MRRKNHGFPAPHTLRDEVASLLDSLGGSGAEKALGINRKTLAWLAAGQPVLDATVTHVRERIREWRKNSEPRLQVLLGSKERAEQ
jgi:hypothetical protein